MKKEDVIKLKVQDYVFEIDGKDIYDVELNYKLSDLEIGYYEKGKRYIKIEPLIEIELNGLNKEKKEASISFCVKTNLEYLNSLENNKIIDITSKLWETEAFVKKPDENITGFINFQFPENNENDMYRKLSTFNVYKYKENSFLFKLSTDDVFTYFKIDFK